MFLSHEPGFKVSRLLEIHSFFASICLKFHFIFFFNVLYLAFFWCAFRFVSLPATRWALKKEKNSGNLDTFTQLQLFNPYNKATVENLGGGHSTMAGGKPQGPAATSKVPSVSEQGQGLWWGCFFFLSAPQDGHGDLLEKQMMIRFLQPQDTSTNQQVKCALCPKEQHSSKQHT